jgi:hypothetical protein
MHDYRDWKRKEINLPMLLLDDENPRLSPRAEPRTQREIAAELVAHDDVYEIAKNIVTHGYFPNEDPIVVYENGEPVVVEGNRRVAACKLIYEPAFIDPPASAKFDALKKIANPKLIKKPTCLIAPSRIAALPLIAARHTENQIQRWKPLMQAAFYVHRMIDGETAEDAAKRFNITPGELAQSIRMYRMYEVVCALGFSPEEGLKVKNPRTFPISTLERLYNMPVIRNWLGFEFDERGEIVGNIDAKEFGKGLQFLTTKVLDETGTSRELNTVDQVKKVLSSAPSEATPNTKKKGSFKGAEIIAAAPTSNAGPPPPAPKPKKKRAPSYNSQALIPGAIECKMKNRRVQALYGDLRGIVVRSYPNAVACTLRSLIEFTVRIHLKNLGELADMKKQAHDEAVAKNKPEPKRDWDSLANMLKHMANSEKAMPYVQNRKAMEKFANAAPSSGLGVLADLHQFTHNENWHPEETDLRKIWKLIEEPMAYIWSL